MPIGPRGVLVGSKAHQKMLREFPFPKKKGRVTAAGPLPILTGFLIKPKGCRTFPFTPKRLPCQGESHGHVTQRSVPKMDCQSSLALIGIIVNLIQLPRRRDRATHECLCQSQASSLVDRLSHPRGSGSCTKLSPRIPSPWT